MTKSLHPGARLESAIHDQTAIVFPNDLNTVGTLFGGRVLEQADRVAAVVGIDMPAALCVTLGVDSVRSRARPAWRYPDLSRPPSIACGHEPGSRRESAGRGFKTMTRRHVFSAYFTFVAVDDELHPVETSPLLAETTEELRQSAGRARRQARLASAGTKLLNPDGNRPTPSDQATG